MPKKPEPKDVTHKLLVTQHIDLVDYLASFERFLETSEKLDMEDLTAFNGQMIRFKKHLDKFHVDVNSFNQTPERPENQVKSGPEGP